MKECLSVAPLLLLLCLRSIYVVTEQLGNGYLISFAHLRLDDERHLIGIPNALHALQCGW